MKIDYQTIRSIYLVINCNRIWFLGLVVIFSLSACGNDSKSIGENIYMPNNYHTNGTDYKISIGDVLKTQFFDVTVRKVSIMAGVNTHNKFTNILPEDGVSFVIIDATFKNTDTESRMILDGSLFINYNGKDYEFDKAETILADGFGAQLDQINPLISKKTKIVYKIPDELVGNMFWNPGRSDSDEVIFLGRLENVE